MMPRPSAWWRVSLAVMPVAFGAIFALIVTSAATAETVTLRLDWLPSGYHAPIFLALQKGYYKAKGIDIEIADGKGTNPALQSAAAGNDMIVLANYTTLVQSVARGMPLIGIGGLIQKTPDAVVSLRDKPITRPQELTGRRVVLTADSAGAKLFAAFVAATGLNAAKIKVLNVTAAGVATTLLQGQADAMIGWSFTDALRVDSQKSIAPPLLFADAGVNVLGNGFVVTRAMANAKPDLLKRFMAATAKGYDEGLKDPGAAVDAMVAARPIVDRELQLRELKVLPPFLHSQYSAGHQFGWTAAEDWQQTYELLQKYFGMEEKIEVGQVYTNDLVTQ
jgi:NitT/TauT family transport system substrate-binding protein